MSAIVNQTPVDADRRAVEIDVVVVVAEPPARMTR
jgi:hypothetical protein